MLLTGSLGCLTPCCQQFSVMLPVRRLLFMESIAAQCQIANLFWQEIGDEHYTCNNGEERSLCGIVLPELTRPFAAFDRGLSGSHNGRHINSVWKAQMSTLFITAPEPCKRNNWLVHLLSPANVLSREARIWCSGEDKNTPASSVMQLLYTSAPYPACPIPTNWRGSSSSLTARSLDPFSCGGLWRSVEENAGKELFTLDLDLVRWVCFCTNDHLLKCFSEERSRFFTWDVSPTSLTGHGVWAFFFCRLRILHFSLCCSLFFLPFFSLKASSINLRPLQFSPSMADWSGRKGSVGPRLSSSGPVIVATKEQSNNFFVIGLLL